MTDRALLIAFGVVGLLAIAVAFAFRRDLARLAGRGPRWRRALFSAGLWLIAPFGIGAGCAHKPAAEEKGKAERAEVDYDNASSDWREEVCSEIRDGSERSEPRASQGSVLADSVDHLAQLQETLDQLGRPPLVDLPGVERVARREAIVAQIKSAREQIHARCGQLAEESLPDPHGSAPTSIASSAEEPWSRIDRLWTEAEAVTCGGYGPPGFDHAARDDLVGRLFRALGDASALAADGEVSSPGGELLRLDLEYLARCVQGALIPDEPPPLCYAPMPFRAPQEDMIVRLKRRLPLIEQLASQQVVRREVVQKVLTRIEIDLAYVRGAEARFERWESLTDQEICLALEWPGPGRWPLPDEEGKPREVTGFCLTDQERDLVERTQRAVEELRARLTASDDEP